MDLEQPLKPALSDQDAQDAQDLAMLGHSQALTRKFDMWSMLSLTFCVLGMLFVHYLPCSFEADAYSRNILCFRAGSQ